VAGPDGVPGNFLFGLYAGDGTIGVAAGNVAGNEDTVYQIDTNPALSPTEAFLNATVLRVPIDPQGRHPDGLAGIPPIAGDLPVPVVTLHTLGDLFVPFSMEQIYARRAAARGAADRLVSRAIRDVLHCGFDPAEEAAAFADLVTWVETGVRPAGDDVLTPAVVAGATFGCQFTQSSPVTAYRALFDPVGCP
jgi:hypothetical protein